MRWYHHVLAWAFPLILLLLAFILPPLCGMHGHEVPRCNAQNVMDCADR